MTPAYLSNTTGRRGGKEETRARYKPPHRMSWANNTVGGQTLSVVGGREGPVILFGYDVHNWRKPSGGETVNTFRLPNAQRQTEAAGNTAGHLWVTEEYFFIAVRLLWAFQKLLQISFNYLPINERACNFAVNTLQKRKLPQSILSALYWRCLWKQHVFLITF